MIQKSFLRTNSGLSNQSKFHKADIIAYTEGGKKSYTLTQIENGEFSSTSIDIDFWKNVLELHNCSKKIYFKALGSKTSGQELTDIIINSEIRNTIIFKDRDLDAYLNKIITHPSIIYTKGYSWENDVFTKENVINILKEYILFDIPVEHIKTIEDCFENIFNIGNKLMRLELIFREKGVRFLSDLSGEALISNGNLNKKLVIEQIKKISNSSHISRPFKYNKINYSFNIYLDCYGKIFESISYHLTTKLVKELADIKNLPKDIFQKNALKQYFRYLINNKDNYYTEIATLLNYA